MKIYLPTSSDPKTGKGFFCQRLAECLCDKVHLVDAKTKHDVSLHLIKLTKTNSRKKIIRLDGIYHNTAMDYKSRNKVIKKNLHAADGVIYQSHFSKALCDKYLGKFKGPATIISNGADPSFYARIHPVKKCKHVFFTSSRWRPHKRLKHIVKSFLLANIEDSCLFVAGDLKKSGIKSSNKIFSDKRVKYIGSVDQSTAASYLKAADAFIHLCWFDSCPNGVVEAIVAGTPVISNNVGGTHEIVRPSGGIVCDVDQPYDLSPVKLYKPPSMDLNLIAEAMRSCSVKRPKITSGHVSIEVIARKYLEFFQRVS